MWGVGQRIVAAGANLAYFTSCEWGRIKLEIKDFLVSTLLRYPKVESAFFFG
uniref:Uncharacterized protein n=1 Tax=Arundo donax TaxID=35708 RepID=A0A0A9B7M3_ARUDO